MNFKATSLERAGQLILAVSTMPRYSHVTLAELTAQFLEPLMQERLLIERAPELLKPKTDDGLLGIVVWASVSEAVDAKIRAQIKTKTYPIKLAREDWRSGNTNWLLDIIAPNEAAALQMTSGQETLSKPHNYMFIRQL